MRPNEIPGRRNPEESRLPARANHKTFANGSKHHRSSLAHARKFFFCMPYGREGTLRASDRGRSALPTCIRKPQTLKPACLPACLLPTACDYNGLDCFDPLVAVFISFPLARAAAAVAAADFCCCCCAPRRHPAPFCWGREVPKKRKSPVASGMAFGHFWFSAWAWSRSRCGVSII